MCKVTSRVHLCGHYTSTLNVECKEADEKGTICKPFKVEDASETKTFCLKKGCDKKVQGQRPGPSK